MEGFLVSSGWVLAWVAGIIFGVILLYNFLGLVLIPDDKIGVVNKKFTLWGARLPDGHVVAMKGEAGIQARTLAPGVHYLYWRWQYSITKVAFTKVAAGHVGIVEAIDGQPMPMGRILARHVDCDMFQDAEKFLLQGGIRGPQMDIIPPGTYRINPSLFTVFDQPALTIEQDKVGIVTVMEGEPLEAGEIAGKVVDGHKNFQDADAFVRMSGQKGLQQQVILAGTYYFNKRFLQVEVTELTTIPIGHVGVVVAYVGTEGKDTTGASFTHGNIVPKGSRGVWADPLDPGRYPINVRTHKVEIVPTTNIVLNWATGKTEAHNLDKNLSTITVRSGDGFTFNLDVSQIIHVARENAPKVISRFGSMANLVTQVLEPTIGNYFRNSAQSSDVIEFLRARTSRQKEASEFIGEALGKYNVQAVDTLIGDIAPPEALMTTLTDRKVAEQSKLTFQIEQAAQEQRQELERATAEANTRGQVVAAERAAQVAKLTATATISKAEGDAKAKMLEAEGAATYTKLTGDAEAAKTMAVGTAEASVLKSKVDAVGADKYAMMNVMDTLAENKIALVPYIQANGGLETGHGGLVDAFLGNILAQAAGAEKKAPHAPEERV